MSGTIHGAIGNKNVIISVLLQLFHFCAIFLTNHIKHIGNALSQEFNGHVSPILPFTMGYNNLKIIIIKS